MKEATKRKHLTLAISGYFRDLARKAGKARMAKISPEERSRIASNAAKARWQKKGGTLG